MFVQAGALGLLAASGGAFGLALVAAILLGIGTALVYPTLIAAVSDTVDPDERAQAVGVYRFWRDAGFVLGALAAGVVADAFGSTWAIGAVAVLTAASGIWVAATRWRRETIEERLRRVQSRITRFEPGEALDASGRGALLVDLRSVDERERHGIIPGSIHIPRSVLEWRLDPDYRHRNPAVADLERELILFCADGFSSSLAVVSARELGFRRVGDLAGGFTGWQAAGLPVQPAAQAAPNELLGMDAPN